MCSFIMAKQKQKVISRDGRVTLLETAKHHGLLSHCTSLTAAGLLRRRGPRRDHAVVENTFFEKLEPMGNQSLTSSSRRSTSTSPRRKLHGMREREE